MSPRDTAVVALLAVGFSIGEVAHQLGCSRRTVEYRLYRLRLRFALRSNYALVAFCVLYVLDDDLFLITRDELCRRVFPSP